MPDAASFGDPPGADTLSNIARIRGLALPNLAALGLGNIKPLAKLLGLPYVPITPLGPIPLPTKWTMRFHEPIRTDSIGPAAADDPGTVLQLTDTVRDVIQKGLVEGLRLRRSIFSG